MRLLQSTTENKFVNDPHISGKLSHLVMLHRVIASPE